MLSKKSSLQNQHIQQWYCKPVGWKKKKNKNLSLVFGVSQTERLCSSLVRQGRYRNRSYRKPIVSFTRSFTGLVICHCKMQNNFVSICALWEACGQVSFCWKNILTNFKKKHLAATNFENSPCALVFWSCDWNECTSSDPLLSSAQESKNEKSIFHQSVTWTENLARALHNTCPLHCTWRRILEHRKKCQSRRLCLAHFLSSKKGSKYILLVGREKFNLALVFVVWNCSFHSLKLYLEYLDADKMRGKADNFIWIIGRR